MTPRSSLSIVYVVMLGPPLLAALLLGAPETPSKNDEASSPAEPNEPNEPAERESTSDETPTSLRLTRLEPPRISPPQLLRMRGSPLRPLTLRDTLDTLRFDRVGLDPSSRTAVVWPMVNPEASPRMHTAVGVGHSVVLGVVEMYARGGAAIGVDATPRAGTQDRNLTVAPQGRFGVHVRPTQRMKVGFELTRRGPMTFDPLGDELRGLASLRWRFGLSPR